MEMNIDRRWWVLLAVALGATAGAAVVSTSRGRSRRAADRIEHKTDLKSWENEGGNLAPQPIETP
jgi:hypothetical protein